MRKLIINILLWLLYKLGWKSVDEVVVKLKRLELHTADLLSGATAKLSDIQLKSSDLLMETTDHLATLQERADNLVINVTNKIDQLQSQAIDSLEDITSRLQHLQLSTSELLAEACRLQDLKERTMHLIQETKRNQLHYQNEEWLQSTVLSKLTVEYPTTPEAELILTIKACCG